MNIANKVLNKIIQESLMDKVKEFGNKLKPKQLTDTEALELARNDLNNFKKSCGKLKEKNRQDYEYCILKKLREEIIRWQNVNITNTENVNKTIKALTKIYNERRDSYIRKYGVK